VLFVATIKQKLTLFACGNQFNIIFLYVGDGRC